MFRHVIVGVDGRPNGRDAITLGLQLVDHDGRLSLAHVYAGEPAASRAANAEFDRVEREDARELLQRERDGARVSADLLVVAADSVGGGLRRLAEDHGGDLIVVGSCHRGAAGRVLVGDDTRETLSGARCAVAVAPAGYAGSARPLGSVGVAYDTSPESRVALALARALAVREDASVRARRVIAYPVTPYMSEAPAMWRESSNAELEAARESLDLPPEVEGDVAMGRVHDELERLSEEVDVLVVGSRNRGRVRRTVLGSTAQHLARHAHCPLLVAPSGEPAAATGPAAAPGVPERA